MWMQMLVEARGKFESPWGWDTDGFEPPGMDAGNQT